MLPAAGGRFPIVALCASSGGLDALSQVLAPLPADLPAAVIVALHRAPHGPGVLADILDRRSALPVRRAVDGDPLRPAQVLVVPEATHMIVGTDGRVRLIAVDGLPPPRPSADLLLSTLAVAAGQRAVAVVLTGNGHDGALGAQAVRAYGGTVLIQEEATAHAPAMPAAVRHLDNPSAALPPDGIAAAIRLLAGGHA